MTLIKSDHPGTLSNEILKSLEMYWGFSLPKDYRGFLLRHNGGEPEFDYFNFKEDKNDGSGVRFFLGIYPDEYRNLLQFLKDYKDRLPSNIFPIAYDSLGNLICISVKGPDRGKVYFWDHELEADSNQGESPSYDNLTLIADSFDEFINSLREFEENE